MKKKSKEIKLSIADFHNIDRCNCPACYPIVVVKSEAPIKSAVIGHRKDKTEIEITLDEN